jgi:hypothetical protein
MADTAINGNRHVRLGATAGAGLRSLCRNGNEMRDEIGARPAAGMPVQPLSVDRREGNEGLAQRCLLSRIGTCSGLCSSPRNQRAAAATDPCLRFSELFNVY